MKIEDFAVRKGSKTKRIKVKILTNPKELKTLNPQDVITAVNYVAVLRARARALKNF